jgi:hypothetical protein
MEKKIFKYLKNRPNGSASSLEIIKDLALNVTHDDFNSIIENLFYRGLLLMPHRQSGTRTDPKYDVIVISDAGRKFIRS